MDRIALIQEQGQRLHQLHARMHEAFAEAPHGPTHRAAAERFHREYDALALPGGLKTGLSRLKDLEPEAIAIAIDFLDANPWFFGSGYIKEEMVRRLKRARLSPNQQVRLAEIILRSLKQGTWRDFRHIVRLAPHLDVQWIAAAIERVASSDDAEAVQRAQHALQVLRSIEKRSDSRITDDALSARPLVS